MTNFAFLPFANRAAPAAMAKSPPAQGKNNDDRHISKPTPREQLILFALGNREMYGLSIQRAIEECSNGEERVSIGALYPILHGLERKHLVESRWGDETEVTGGARRRYYRLSPTGALAVERILQFQHRLLNWQDKPNEH